MGDCCTAAGFHISRLVMAPKIVAVLLVAVVKHAAAQEADAAPGTELPPARPPPFAPKMPSVSTFSPEYKKIEEEAGLWNQEIVENAYKLGGQNFEIMIERYRALIRKIDGELDAEAEKYTTQDELIEAKEEAKRKIEAHKREKEA